MSTPQVRDAVLRVGEVTGVEGRRVFVAVDKGKNLSEIFLDGDVIRNIAVNSLVEIRKGFLSLIGRVEGERIEEDGSAIPSKREGDNRLSRLLTISLTGYFDVDARFVGGVKELPLIGNEVFVLSASKVRAIHSLVRSGASCIDLAEVYGETFPVRFPVDGLFNSHIAIFGNTGSGKSNTLARMYQELIFELTQRDRHRFSENYRLILFDFNGEYAAPNCIWEGKTVYSLSTRRQDADRLPLGPDGLLDIEVISILADATEKTQKPFLRRALRLLDRIGRQENPTAYARSILRQQVKNALTMGDRIRALQLVDYFRSIFNEVEIAEDVDFLSDIEWHTVGAGFRLRNEPTVYFNAVPIRTESTVLYRTIDQFAFRDSSISKLVVALYMQLIDDVRASRAVNEHVAPVIGRLQAKKGDIDKLFDLQVGVSFWRTNVVVINLDDVNLDMKKTIPLLISKKLYLEQKTRPANTSLSIVIDEAHNILSRESFRESESWKDYRLETFEEVIKEGRKFGVFVTIASQRPGDISPTITSQAHNYFVHRLINQQDLKAVATAVSYIDQISEESIPSLPTGTCIFGGIATQMPLKITIKPLPGVQRPRSATRTFSEIV